MRHPTARNAMYESRTVGRRPLPMTACEVAHRGLVGELNDSSFGSGFEHRVDVIWREPRDHAQLRMLLLHAANVLGVRAARRMPHVPQLERPADRALRAAADPDLWL